MNSTGIEPVKMNKICIQLKPNDHSDISIVELEFKFLRQFLAYLGQVNCTKVMTVYLDMENYFQSILHKF